KRHQHFTRVLMQQGRVQLDSDWNEQTAIFWDYLRHVVTDLLGPCAGPETDCGFAIKAEGDLDDMGLDDKAKREFCDRMQGAGDFLIGKGRYYVDGLMCENHHSVTYSQQANYLETNLLDPKHTRHLVYLDVWERYVSLDEDPAIGEPALRGA